MSTIYIPNATADEGVTLAFLEANYSRTNFINSQLNTKLSLTGTTAMAGSIIPDTDESYDLGSASLKFNNIFTNTITNVSTEHQIILSGTDLSLVLDGVTDDTSALQTGLEVYESTGQAVQLTINSQFGMALHGLVTVPTNVHMTVNCNIYAYGDAGIRTFGDFYEGPVINMDGGDVTTADRIMVVVADHGLTAGDVVKIRGRNDNANTGAIEFETNIVTNVATDTITFLNLFQNDYEAIFLDQTAFVDRTHVVILQGSLVSTPDATTMNRGDTNFTVADGTVFQKGDVVTIKDFVTIADAFTNNTSNNTFRDDINRISDVTGNVITIETPLSHTYEPTTSNVYITKIKPTTKTKFENFRMIHKKYPTNRNNHCFGLFNSLNSTILNCSVINYKRNKTIIVNTTVGTVFTVIETTGTLTVSYTIPDGDYIISDLCALLATNLTTQSASTGNTLTYTCTYDESTGAITLASTGNFRIPYVAGRAPLICGFMPSDSDYPSGTTFTGERVDLSGNFLLPENENHFYFTESAGGGEKDITLSRTIYWSQGTLMKQLAEDMTTDSSGGYTYTVTMDNTEDTIIFENSSAGNFSINTTEKTDKAYRYFGLHDAKGIIIASLSGADNYDSETDMSSVPIRLTPTSKGHGFRVDTSLYCVLDGCYFGPSEHVSSGESYGYAVYRCRGNLITNCVSIQGRHGILFQTAQANQVFNFTDVNARISAIDFHGLGSNDNLIDGALIQGGVAYSPDATSHSAIKVANTFHVAGDSYNTIRNVRVTGYANSDATKDTYIIYLLPISNFNVIENVTSDGCNIGIYCTDVTSKNNAEFVINDNVIKNCTFHHAEQPFNIDMRAKSTTLVTCNRLLIDSCIFDNIGTGSSDESRARIQDNVDDCTIQNCTFRNIVAGSNDVETIYVKDTSDCHILNNTFNNVFRGVYLDNVNANPIVAHNKFIDMAGSSHVVIRDDGNSTDGQYMYNEYLGSTIPRTNLTGTDLILRHANTQAVTYTSNATALTTITNTVTLNNTPPTSGGATVMGTTTITYSSHRPHGTCHLKGVVHYQLPGTISADSSVVLLLFHDLSATAELIGHTIKGYTTTQTSMYDSIQVDAEFDFTDRLSSGSSSFLLNIGTVSGDGLIICSTFGAKPYFKIFETDIQTL